MYPNFVDHDEGPERLVQAFGEETLQRLSTVKHEYDPEGVLPGLASV